MVIGLVAPEQVLLIMGADDVILETGRIYLKIVLLFAPAFILNYTMTAFVRNDDNPNVAMAATISSSLFNIIFDFIFMFPMGMGINGAALATGISPIVSMLVCLIHYCSKRNTVQIVWKRISIKKLIGTCTLGTGAFVGEIASGITTLAFNYMLLGIAGNIGVAAYGVIANVSLVGIAIFNGISQGLQPMASEAGGKQDKAAQTQILRHSLWIGTIIAVILIVLCFAFCEQIVAVFNSEKSADMAAYAERGIKMYSIGFLFAVINIVSSGYYAAVGMAKKCTLISVLRGIAAILVFVLLLPRVLGIDGVWLAFPAAELATFFVSVMIRTPEE